MRISRVVCTCQGCVVNCNWFEPSQRESYLEVIKPIDHEPNATMKTQYVRHLPQALLAIALAGTATAHQGNHDASTQSAGLSHYLTSPNHVAPLIIIPLLLVFAWFCHCKAKAHGGN